MTFERKIEMPGEAKRRVQDSLQPWLLTAPEYNITVCDRAWARPELGRMMLNESTHLALAKRRERCDRDGEEGKLVFRPHVQSL